MVFEEYEAVAALRVHHGKTVVLPLYPVDHDSLRRVLAELVPGWADLGIADSARYLGFELGPGKGDKSWKPAIAKMRVRARAWREVGPGMCISMQALRMYVYSLASFLVQLETLPPDWPQVEREILSIMFPGPRGWCSPAAFRHLDRIGFPYSAPDLVSYADAAKCRVARWEDCLHGGLRVRSRYVALATNIHRTDYLDRRYLWRDWPG